MLFSLVIYDIINMMALHILFFKTALNLYELLLILQFETLFSLFFAKKMINMIKLLSKLSGLMNFIVFLSMYYVKKYKF